MKEIITKSEARMKEYVTGEIEKVNIKITEMDKRSDHPDRCCGYTGRAQF